MPLIVLTLNTSYPSNAPNVPIGTEKDGTFRFSKRLEFIPPKESEFHLRHVFFDAGKGGVGGGGRNKTPTIWMSLDFPQMESIIHTNVNKKNASGTFNDGSGNVDVNGVVNDFGILKFPINTFPITESGVNKVNRQANNAAAESYMHECNHNMDINLGRMNLENGFLECILTPRDLGGLLNFERIGNVRLCRFLQAQIILEYN
jgi:hypothetical protein